MCPFKNSRGEEARQERQMRKERNTVLLATRFLCANQGHMPKCISTFDLQRLPHQSKLPRPCWPLPRNYQAAAGAHQATTKPRLAITKPPLATTKPPLATANPLPSPPLSTTKPPLATTKRLPRNYHPPIPPCQLPSHYQAPLGLYQATTKPPFGDRQSTTKHRFAITKPLPNPISPLQSPR